MDMPSIHTAAFVMADLIGAGLIAGIILDKKKRKDWFLFYSIGVTVWFYFEPVVFPDQIDPQGVTNAKAAWMAIGLALAYRYGFHGTFSNGDQPDKSKQVKN
jgi:hypothetical protein